MNYRSYITRLKKLVKSKEVIMDHHDANGFRDSGDLRSIIVEKEHLFRFVNENNGNVEHLILLFSLEEVCRSFRNWDQNVETLLEAAGYLCGKYQNLCDYVVDKIKYEENGVSIYDSKYSYMWCLTLASLWNPKVMKQVLDFGHLWNGLIDGFPGREKELSDAEKEQAESLRPDAMRGFWDARKNYYRYGSASVATIKGLIELAQENPPDYLSYYHAMEILFLFLGERNIVTCVDANFLFGAPQYIEKDFTEDVIGMFRKNPPHYQSDISIYGGFPGFELAGLPSPNKSYHQLLRKWYENSPEFQRELSLSIDFIKPLILKGFYQVWFHLKKKIGLNGFMII